MEMFRLLQRKIPGIHGGWFVPREQKPTVMDYGLETAEERCFGDCCGRPRLQTRSFCDSWCCYFLMLVARNVMLLYLFASALLLSAYLQITPKFQCDSTSLHGPVKLVISDLHVHPNLPALDYRMRQVVQQARKTWSTTGTLVLGDLMHWAGGLTFANWNLSTPEWKEMAERVKWVVDDADATYIPGNHDLNDTSTQRWNAAFGRYDRTVNLFPNATAYLSSSMAPKAHHSPVVLAHYPIEDARDPLWHPNMKLALNGHKHFIEQRKFNGTRQHTLPTLNPYQAVSNNHFDGSGEQGFALLDSSLHVKMCKVYFLWA